MRARKHGGPPGKTSPKQLPSDATVRAQKAKSEAQSDKPYDPQDPRGSRRSCGGEGGTGFWCVWGSRGGTHGVEAAPRMGDDGLVASCGRVRGKAFLSF
ncbi:hypothetical protein GUJ93_ZPchr0003g16537 [Zizania palustris]|uniref:Uncharacterized protein n=1 Tax=Zizania palustris TaxID=103762 RepID=A0A8J5VJJ2_ZIZPA|nr:hypothetical protein GUJ93_ZPchr0003g16537 [Zizania palustris]